jgi:myo-inositol 2-dehydrogenase / D-chiro-inositol 1-dehydrogenase
MNHRPIVHAVPRRRFLAGAAALTTVSILSNPVNIRAATDRVVNLGLIGCGGRGAWIADLFAQTGKYRWVACADYFRDRVEAVGAKQGISSNRQYSGLDGYKRLLEGSLDAVVIETPPWFHPHQALDAIAAGKHVFLAKPIAVDVPGCLTIAKAGQRATEQKLAFLVDFQTRANPLYREALSRVRRGDIGRIVMGEAHYPWRGGGRGAPPDTAEGRLRNWYYVLELSGDFIVEQSIHALDVATWILDADPVSAVGVGGRGMRPANSIYDHFALTYLFPGQVPLSFTCIQAVPEVRDEISTRVFGTDGYIYTDYFGQVWIRGNEFYQGGDTGNLYTTGTQVNIDEFHQAITQGFHDNPTVAPSVRSNLTAILGREAAYRGGELTLQTLVNEGQSLEPDLSGLRSG